MNRAWVWRLRTRVLEFRRPLVMGIVNVTPDSFSDGGQFADPASAVAHGRRLIEQGADLVDVGGESTRPGAAPVSVDEELRRVIPVVEGLGNEGIIVSVDTAKPEVADLALRAGAEIVNDVTGLSRRPMRETVAAHGAGAVIMHMQGEPRTMQANPRYEDVQGEIHRFLDTQVRTATAEGMDPDSIVIDPGIGFGKTVEHNLVLCNRLESFNGLGRPVLIGTSRKRFLGAITGVEEPSGRDLATAVSMALAVERGAAVLRVHDVGATLEAASIALAIVRESPVDSADGVISMPATDISTQ